MAGIAAVLEHFHRFVHANGDIRIGTLVESVDEILQILLVRSRIDGQERLLALNFVGIGDDTDLVSLR
ncbi:hypothetical protein D3C71_1378340 [compost metagenome]